MNKLLFQLFILLFVLGGCQNPVKNKVALSQEDMLAKASRNEKNGWIQVHMEGSPEVIGFQHGYLLADEILDARGAVSMYYGHSTGKSWDFFRDESMKLFWHETPEEYRKEMDGIVNGVNAKLGEGKIDRADVVAMNSILETSSYYVPWYDKQMKASSQEATPPGHCSAIAATGSWTTDGKIVMAHNNWSAYVVGQRWNIILDIVPEKGNRIVMDALPGFIHSGDDFNINSAGLIVTETTITQFQGFDTTGVAEFVRARKAIQYANTIDEWVNTMKERNNGGYANDWLIGDNKTGEIARLELGLKNQFLERTQDGYFVGANFPIHTKLIQEETSFDTTFISSSPNVRKARWAEIMKDNKGKIDVEAAKRYMGDHYNVLNNTEKASGVTLCGHFDSDEVPATYWGQPAFDPNGAVQGKATDGTLAGEMQLWAIIGHPCGEAFIVKDFLQQHPEFNYQAEYLRDMPGQVWTLFGK